MRSRIYTKPRNKGEWELIFSFYWVGVFVYAKLLIFDELSKQSFETANTEDSAVDYLATVHPNLSIVRAAEFTELGFSSVSGSSEGKLVIIIGMQCVV